MRSGSDGVISTPIDITEADIVDSFGAMDEVERLGSGTFGTTFRVSRDDDEYAIKIIHLPGLPQYLWDREVSILGRVDHPNVLALRDNGLVTIQGNDLPYFTSEYVNGGTLRQRIEAGSLPGAPEDVNGLLTGLLAGIAEIHDLGGLHRDIKPENVALREGGWGQPVLLDFGLARLADMSTHTQYPSLKGTPAYMSPEQLRGKPARTRSDLFSVGVTVYETGTGTHPFGVTHPMTLQELHDRIAAGPPQDPRTFSNAFGERAAEVVMRLLAYRGHERLSAEDALGELEDADAD
jgi:serine/threonine protein kinase